MRRFQKNWRIPCPSVRARIYASTGFEFNINSPKQLSQVLFERLGLKPVRKTKTGFSTDEDVLKRLASQHDVPGLIITYRQTAKLKSTYVDALINLSGPAFVESAYLL